MTKNTDIIIIGGGLVGASMGLVLAQAGIDCHIIENSPRGKAINSEFDGRSSAVSEASYRLLSDIGISGIIKDEGEPILDIFVVDGYSKSSVHYDHAQIGDLPFGYIVPNATLRSALINKVESQKNLSISYETSAENISYGEHEAMASLTNGEELAAKLIIAADGRFSKTRLNAKINHRIIDYNQTAIVCTIEHSKPHNGWAVERFLPAGPFAVLPMTDNRSSIVWTEKSDMAEHYLSLDDVTFTHELKKRIGDWLGDIKLISDKFAYPLTLMLAEKYTSKRLALVGDAAHAIHPIAGQGVNLGYRDVAALSELIINTKSLGLDIGLDINLSHYQKWRSFDASSVSLATDAINRLFSNSNSLVMLARRFGLSSVDRLPELKNFFMLHSMGLLGDLPKVLRKHNNHSDDKVA